MRNCSGVVQELGGIKYMVLSHVDDVADHAKWAAHFGCDRIMHATECGVNKGTDAVEIQVDSVTIL